MDNKTELSRTEKKQIIIDVLAEVGTRQYMARLKKTSGFEGMTPSDVAMIYHDMNNLDCPNGKQLKFKSITDGFKFCGVGKKCQCVIDSQSGPAKPRSREDQLKINEKREQTNLKNTALQILGILKKQLRPTRNFIQIQPKYQPK